MDPLGFGTVLGLAPDGVVCLATTAGRVVPPDALVPGTGSTLRLRATAVGAPRPRIGFFADRAGLEAFLARSTTEPLIPVLEEAGPGGDVWHVPVLTQATVETALGSITIAEVAVPLSTEAVALWGQVATVQTAPLPLVVLDRRGHATGFAEAGYDALAVPLHASGAMAEGVNLVEIGPGALWSAPRPVPLAALDPVPADPDPALPRPRVAPGPFPAFDQPTLLLLAGDMDLSLVPGLVDNRNVLVVQVTPELDWALRDSAAGLNLPYLGYGTPPESLAQAVMALPGLALGGRAAEDRLLAQAAAAQVELGFPPVAPTGALALTEDGATWVALRLWVVVTPDLLELVPM